MQERLSDEEKAALEVQQQIEKCIVDKQLTQCLEIYTNARVHQISVSAKTLQSALILMCGPRDAERGGDVHAALELYEHANKMGVALTVRS
jgi:hypothetical protein